MWTNVYDKSPTQTIDYQFKKDTLLWKWLKHPQYMQRTWWHTMTTAHSGLRAYYTEILWIVVVWIQADLSISFRAYINAVRYLTAKSREVSKPRNWMLWWLYHSDIWQASRQHCCQGACQISEWLEKSKPESQQLRDFTRFCGRTSTCLVNIGPGSFHRHWGNHLSTETKL